LELRLIFGLRFSGKLDCNQSIQKIPDALTAELGLTHVQVRNKNSDARYTYPPSSKWHDETFERTRNLKEL
jgi:hypothetical protein